MKRFALFLSPWLAAGALAAQGSVLVVDPSNGPGTDYTTLADALAAAVDGDIVLLKTGDHPPATIDGKALFLLEASGATAVVEQLTIRNVPAAKTLVVRGVDVSVGPTTAGSIFLQDCDGNVWFEDCSASGSIFERPCVSCRDCASVVFVNSFVAGGSEQACGTTGALTSVRSNVFLFDTTVLGRERTVIDYPPFFLFRDGEEAVRLEDGSLWVHGSSLTGGEGGWNFNAASCVGGSDGGAGLALRGTSPAATVLDSTLTGGYGGLGYCGPDGESGPPIDRPVGTVETIDATARALEVPSPLQVGEVATLTWHGEPGDRAFLLYSLDVGPGQLFSRLLLPAKLIGPSFLSAPRSIAAGVLDGNGELLEPVSIGGLDAGLEGLGLYTQGLLLDVSLRELFFSNPAHALLLDLDEG